MKPKYISDLIVNEIIIKLLNALRIAYFLKIVFSQDPRDENLLGLTWFMYIWAPDCDPTIIISLLLVVCWSVGRTVPNSRLGKLLFIYFTNLFVSLWLHCFFESFGSVAH